MPSSLMKSDARPAIGSRLRRALLAAAFVALAAPPGHGDVIGEARVIDGDTIQVAGERVRLQGIDAPESRQTCSVSGAEYSCGQNAKRTLTGATAGREIVCKGEKRDRYGRLLATCYAGNEDINARMVRSGWALAYRRYDKAYVPQEAEARSAGAGMWAGQFVDPWDWRHQSREAQAEAAR